MSWPSLTYAGVPYTFDHLAPRTFSAHGKRVRVIFGAHAFTIAHKPGHPASLQFQDGGTLRTFDVARYWHSLHLPAAIAAAMNGPVYRNGSRYLFKGTIAGIKGTYVIAFDLRLSKSPKYDFKVQVVSAHLTQKTKQLPRADFGDVLNALESGAAVIWL